MIRGVPYDHQLEYIESTGTQWIDTGFTPDLTKDFSVDCTAGWVTNNRGMLLSSYTSSGGLNNVSLELYDRKRWRSYVAGDRSIISYDGDLGELAHLSFSYTVSTGVAITALNGTSNSSTVPSAGRIVNTRTAILGSDQLHRYPYGRYGRMRIYNPGLVCDLIPVSVNGVAKMYDRATGTFPKHYGTFVAGPVASTPLMGVHMYPTANLWKWPTRAATGSAAPATVWTPILDVVYTSYANNGYMNTRYYDVFAAGANTIVSTYSGGYSAVVFKRLPAGKYKFSAKISLYSGTAPSASICVVDYAPSAGQWVRSGGVSSGWKPFGIISVSFTVEPDHLVGINFNPGQNGVSNLIEDARLIEEPLT